MQSRTVAALLQQEKCLIVKSNLSRYVLGLNFKLKAHLNSAVSTCEGIKCIQNFVFVIQLRKRTQTCSDIRLLQCGEAGSKNFLGRVVGKGLVARCSLFSSPSGDAACRYMNCIKSCSVNFSWIIHFCSWPQFP